jgi:hypothetical protein
VDSIECKIIRQKTPKTVHEEPARKETAVTCSAQILGLFNGLLNGWTKNPKVEIWEDLTSLPVPKRKGAEIDHSIECYRQRLKKIRQKIVTTVHTEPTHEVVDAKNIQEETAAICSLKILEAKLASKIPTDSESTASDVSESQNLHYPSFSTNEPQSDVESDVADKSSDEHGDPAVEKAPTNHEIVDSGRQWPTPVAAFPGAHFFMRPRVGPRGGLIVQPRQPSKPNSAPTHAGKLGDLIASNCSYSKLHGAY